MKTIDKLINHSEVSEKAIERYLVERIKDLGGICLKYSNQHRVGYPDRVCLLPWGVTLWVELKSKGQTLRTIQLQRIQEMSKIGHIVHVCDSKEAVDNVIASIRPHGAV
jgi:hypothetical protein